MPIRFPDIPQRIRAYVYRLIAGTLPLLVILGVGGGGGGPGEARRVNASELILGPCSAASVSRWPSRGLSSRLEELERHVGDGSEQQARSEASSPVDRPGEV
jgi:hypothetical protein